MNHLMTGSPGSSPLCPHIQIEKVSVVAVVLLLLLQLPSYDMNVEVDLPPELMKAVQCSHPLVTLVRWYAVQQSLQQSCQSVQSCSQVAAAVSGVECCCEY